MAFWAWVKDLLGGNETAIAPAVVQPSPDSVRNLGLAPRHFDGLLLDLCAEAAVDAEPLLARAADLHRAAETSDPRNLDKLLRELLPQAAWQWPGYAKWAAMSGQKGTRLQMVSAFASMLERRISGRLRLAQLHENAERRPYWRLHAVGDALDWPDCPGTTGVVHRHDSAFWRTNGPHACKRVGCRCSIRALTQGERQT